MANNRTAIYLNNDKYNNLIDEIDALNIFENNIHLYLFAGSLGFSENAKIDLKANGKEIDPNANKTLRDNMHHIRSIAVSSFKDIKDLEENDKCYEEFSKYVNGGLQILDEKFNENPKKDDFITELISLINRQAIKNIKNKTK